MTLAGDAFVDSVVIGGGLAGLLGALRLADAGHSVVLFDQALPQAGGRLGGFAEFSGAKFSLAQFALAMRKHSEVCADGGVKACPG